jgi:aconitate hydratase
VEAKSFPPFAHPDAGHSGRGGSGRSGGAARLCRRAWAQARNGRCGDPIDLVIDHSVHVDHSGSPDAAARNLALEYVRNAERYRFFKWAERAFERLNIVPPGQGICHQINLERLTSGCIRHDGQWIAETVIGTDSHTTMVNALGVLGWGVGGIEAELAALGAPVPIALPRVVEVRLEGALAEG